MMKLFFLTFVALTLSANSAELTHITLGKQDFSIVTEEYDIYDSKGSVMKLYKEERNNDLSYILSHTLYDITGACADKSIQEGAFEINGTQITLYSFWDRRGRVYDSPYGVRITYYELSDEHNLIKKSSMIYIESQRKKYNEDSGMKYLFQKPQTDQEKEAFKNYIQEMERFYKGTFVFGDEAEKLIKEVKQALTRKIKRIWQKQGSL